MAARRKAVLEKMEAAVTAARPRSPLAVWLEENRVGFAALLDRHVGTLGGTGGRAGGGGADRRGWPNAPGRDATGGLAAGAEAAGEDREQADSEAASQPAPARSNPCPGTVSGLVPRQS